MFKAKFLLYFQLWNTMQSTPLLVEGYSPDDLCSNTATPT